MPVPLLTPKLSSWWLRLVTPLYARVGRKLIDSVRYDTVVHDPEAMKAQLVEMIKGYITPYQVARLGLVDEVIDPRETRNQLIRGLEVTRNKTCCADGTFNIMQRHR